MERRLYRSRTDRILGGVCGGLARYFDVDPTLVRLAWLLTSLWAGAGVVVYLVAWIVIPREPREGWYDEQAARSRPAGSENARNAGRLLGWVLLILGAAVFLRVIGGVLAWMFEPGVFVALLLVVIGLFLLGKRGHGSRVR
ncbi:MAG TPA: PspC domain-containing protein [Limnochordales bacterium]|nr:PspC domain-containing protein [Limnochordales bacterium]